MVELTKRSKRCVQMCACMNEYDLFILPMFIRSSGSRDIKYMYKYSVSTLYTVQSNLLLAVYCGVHSHEHLLLKCRKRVNDQFKVSLFTNQCTIFRNRGLMAGTKRDSSAQGVHLSYCDESASKPSN